MHGWGARGWRRGVRLGVAAALLAATAVVLGAVFGRSGVGSGASALAIRVSGNSLLDADGKPMRLAGVNDAGPEYACVRGTGVFDGPADASTVQALASWHVQIVRIPLNEDCWLGINGVPAAYGGPAYQQAIEGFVNLLHQNGLFAELSVAWGAPGAYVASHQPEAPDADHAPAVWASLASAFSADPAVILAPWGETVTSWACFRDGCANQATYGSASAPYQTAGMQQAVDVMRQAGYHGAISIPCIDQANDCADAAGSWLQYEPVDPDHQLIAEAHVYGNDPCGAQNRAACLDRTIAPLAQQVPVIFGQTGETNNNSECTSTNAQVILPWADAHNVSYEAWTWDTWRSCDSLISDVRGTPNTSSPAGAAYGKYVHDHLLSVNAAPTPPTTATTAATNGSSPSAAGGRADPPSTRRSSARTARSGRSSATTRPPSGNVPVPASRPSGTAALPFTPLATPTTARPTGPPPGTIPVPPVPPRPGTTPPPTVPPTTRTTPPTTRPPTTPPPTTRPHHHHGCSAAAERHHHDHDQAAADHDHLHDPSTP